MTISERRTEETARPATRDRRAATRLEARVDARRVSLEWQRDTRPDTSYYRVYRATGSDEPRHLMDTTATTALDTTVEPGATYRYTVSMVNGDGDETPLSIEKTVAIGRRAIAARQPIVVSPNVVVLAVTTLLVALVAVLLFTLLPFARPAPDATIQSANAQVGADLVRYGVVLLFVAFLAAIVTAAVTTFVFSARPGGRAEQGVDAGLPWDSAVKALPTLLRQPAGYGAILVLLGVLLLATTALGSAALGAATAASTPGATATPAVGASPSPSSPAASGAAPRGP